MREILFRGQTRKYGKRVWMSGEKLPSNWVYGSLLPGGGDYSLIYEWDDDTLTKHTVYSDTVGQYTGLNDKYGKKIFEGDILRITERGQTVDGAIVVFENGYPGGWILTDKKRKSKCSLAMRTNVEIIGNVYDNVNNADEEAGSDE